MKCIILGGTGYLGNKLIHELIKYDNEIVCLYRNEISLNKFDDVKNKVRFISLDNLFSGSLSTESFDCMVNLSCKYPRNANNDIDIFESNLINPLKILLYVMENNNISKFVTLNTGLPNEFNIYSLSKSKFADISMWYTKNYGISVIDVLLENFYGEDEPRDRFIPSVIQKLKNNEKILLTDGTQIRDFIYIDDVVINLVKFIMNNTNQQYVQVPLGSGEGVSIRNLIEYLKTITKSSSYLGFGEIEKRRNEPDSVADKNIMKKYGVEIKYDWKKGFSNMISKWRD